MLVDIVVVKQGMAMAEATLVAWLVEPGSAVEQGDPVAEIATDKVEMEIEAPVAGRLVERLIEVDAEFAVPGVIGRIAPAA